MRGRTLNDSFVILDEAQNTTPEQMKMFLTRLGFGSRMVVTGDITQVDLPRDQQSGLIVVGDILDDVEGIEFVRFGGEDVVRHKLVQRIVEAYGEHAERQAPGLRPADAARLARDARRRGHRRRRAGRAARAEIERLVGLALAAAGHRRRARRGRVRRRRSGSPSSTAPTAASDAPTDVLSFPIDEDRTRRSAPRELGDIVICPRAHRRTCARPSSTARCTSSAWTTRPTTARCWRSRRELAGWWRR